MPSTSAEMPRARKRCSRTRCSSSRTPRIPCRPLMRASPRKRSGYSRTSSATSSLDAPNGTARTMPTRSASRVASCSPSGGAGWTASEIALPSTVILADGKNRVGACRHQQDRRLADMARLQDKVAIVTGASKGIGASIARHLADEGAAVVVNYASSKAGPDRVVADITSHGGTAIAVQANIAEPADVERLFDETRRAFGRLDILVNNAGVYEFFPLEDVTAERFHKHFDLNVLGLLL